MQWILKDRILSLAVLTAFFFILTTATVRPQPISRSNYLVPPKVINNLSMGFSTQAADSFWLRAVQDFDFCDQAVNSKECRGKSWLFQVLDLTTDLDSEFLSAYFYGGLSLTVVVNDFAGATQIFDKGVLKFPKDWQLAYAAGYQATYEEKNKLKASKLYYAAAENGAPAWVHVLAGRLAKEGGDGEFAELILKQMIATAQEPKLVERLQKKLDEFQKTK